MRETHEVTGDVKSYIDSSNVNSHTFNVINPSNYPGYLRGNIMMVGVEFPAFMLMISGRFGHYIEGLGVGIPDIFEEQKFLWKWNPVPDDFANFL